MLWYEAERPESVTLVRRAAEVVRAVADRLASPERVAEIAGAPSNTLTSPQGVEPVWRPVGLGDGFPAVGLLFAELAATDPAQRRRVHAHLSAAVGALRSGTPRLYAGMASLAFAGQAAAASFGGYAGMLERLDREIAQQIRERLAADRERIVDGRPIGVHDGYDVISGAAGVGRYLLDRYQVTGDPTVGEALTDVLDTLVAIGLAEDVPIRGKRLPPWWAYHVGTGRDGHLNLGLAHGVAGPLALLALAWRDGIRTNGQREAVERIVALLSRWRIEHDDGPGWPRWVGPEDYAAVTARPGAAGSGAPDVSVARRPREREVWCYGGAGVGRALHLAGSAFDRPDWWNEGRRAVRAAVDTAEDRVIHDFALCHGWSGLLQISSRMAADTGDVAFRNAADRLAGQVLAGWDPAAPFGFRYRQAAGLGWVDRPGFLEGAAGIALALHTYASSAPPRTDWDAALLLA